MDMAMIDIAQSARGRIMNLAIFDMDIEPGKSSPLSEHGIQFDELTLTSLKHSSLLNDP